MKAIIFDFDGVIHDTLEDLHRVHCETLEELTLDEMKDRIFNENPREYLDKFTDEEIKIFDETWKNYYEELKLEKTIREELEILSQDFLLFIISSNREITLNRYFENNNFLNVFQEIYGAETHKSKVKKFKILFQKHNLDADSCIFVTDTLGDILEANQVGVKSIACTFGFHERERLEKGKPFRMVSNFKEIRKVIESL